MIKRFNLLFLLCVCLIFVSCEESGSTPNSGVVREPTGVVAGHKLVYTKHAHCRMRCRHIDETEVEEILNTNHVNENKSEHDAVPCPKIAYEGMSHDHQSIRIIIAQCETEWKVVTCVDLGNEFACECK